MSKYTRTQLQAMARQALSVRGTWQYVQLVETVAARTGLSYAQTEARIQELAR